MATCPNTTSAPVSQTGPRLSYHTTPAAFFRNALRARIERAHANLSVEIFHCDDAAYPGLRTTLDEYERILTNIATTVH